MIKGKQWRGSKGGSKKGQEEKEGEGRAKRRREREVWYREGKGGKTE